jgi:hypothetical protein
MPLYFFLLDADPFHRRIVPALSAAWSLRSFEPCRPLCESLAPAVRSFQERYHTGTEEPLIGRVSHGLSFDRGFWRLLVGEVLLYAAAEVPEIQTAPETLCCLLAPGRCAEGLVPRAQFAPIQQAHFGTRDLVFGSGFYRPEQAGYNDVDDAVRLADYLQSVDPGRWTLAGLSDLRDVADEEERAEELEFARDWFPSLRDLYVRARQRSQIVVCEVL